MRRGSISLLTYKWIGYWKPKIPSCRYQYWDIRQGGWRVWQAVEAWALYLTCHQHYLGWGALCQQVGRLSSWIQDSWTTLVYHPPAHTILRDFSNNATYRSWWRYEQPSNTKGQCLYTRTVQWPCQCQHMCTPDGSSSKKLPRSRISHSRGS